MTGAETFSLILDTLTAIGAVAAVAVSVWIVLRKQSPFAIRGIKVTAHTISRSGAMRKEGPAQEVSYSLTLKIENLRDVRMQVFEVAIEADHSKSKKDLHTMSTSFSRSDIFIPEKSIYDVEYKIDSKSVVGAYSKAKDITLTISTSFGDTIVPFPQEWRAQLYEAMEEPWPFNSPSPFSQANLKRAG